MRLYAARFVAPASRPSQPLLLMPVLPGCKQPLLLTQVLIYLHLSAPVPYLKSHLSALVIQSTAEAEVGCG